MGASHLHFVSTPCLPHLVKRDRVAGGWLGFVLVLVLDPGTAVPAGTAGTAAERGKRLLARNSEDEQTLVPPSRPDARY